MSAAKMECETSFYVTGGTLSREAASYVLRQADQQLYDRLRQGRLCYVLTARQMGKSSLMVRTAARLREAGVGVAVLDLTALGQNLSAEQWYSGLLTQMGQLLDLEDELEAFWDQNRQLGPLQRWMQAVRQVVLPRYPSPVVIFVDEIDAVRSLPFSTDEFFAGIREFYNRRTEDPALGRLSFCLLGVATPSELIRDTRTTPFNIGTRIELHDFTDAEAATLTQGFGQEEGVSSILLNRVLYWTGGHPYLTQRLCQAVAEPNPQSATRNPQSVDRLCESLFFERRAKEQDDNLLFVRERMLRSEADPAGLLSLYAQVLRGRRVEDDETNPLVSVLRLSGITRVEDGRLRVRNRIYARVFDRKLLAAYSADHSIRLWDLAAGRELRRLTGHTQFITSLSFSRDGKMLASTSDDQTVRLWEVGTGKMLQTLKGHTKGVASATFSPDGRKAVTASEDETVKLWDVATGKQLMTLKEHPAKGSWNAPQIFRAVFSPDGSRVLATGNFTSVAVWDAATGQVLPALEGHGSWIIPLAFSRDGKLMATGSGDRTIRLWDVSTWRLMKSLTGHGNQVYELAFSRDGQTLASFSTDQTIKLWDVAAVPNPLERGGARLAAYAPDGQRLASAQGDDVQLWDTTTWQVIATLKGRWSGTTERRIVGITSLAYSPDGKILAIGSEDKTARLWDLATGQERFVLEGHTGQVWGVAFSPDGKLLATGSYDKTVRLWDVTTGQELAKLEGHEAIVCGVAFSPDGQLLASASWDTTVKLWDVAARRELTTLKGHTAEAYGVAFSPDGKLLATTSADSTIKLWDVAACQELSTLKGHAGIIMALAFSPDGKRLATAGQDFTVRLWDVATGQELAALRRHTDSIQSVAFSPDGQTLVSAGNDGRLLMWRAATEQEVRARRR
jgi:WD40 repeat protein